jgi:para-aminobenzoate synthetase component 1
MRIRFDEGPVALGSDFQTPTEIITVTTMAELAPAFARLEAGQRAGHWLAGYASYELGYLFEPRLRARLPTSRRLPLLQFGLYGPPQQTPRLVIYPVVRHP